MEKMDRWSQTAIYPLIVEFCSSWPLMIKLHSVLLPNRARNLRLDIRSYVGI